MYVCLPTCPTDCLTDCLPDYLTDWLTVSLSSRCTAEGNRIFRCQGGASTAPPPPQTLPPPLQTPHPPPNASLDLTQSPHIEATQRAGQG